MMFVVLVDLKPSRVSKVHWDDFKWFFVFKCFRIWIFMRWSVKQFDLRKISKWFWLTLVILIRETSVFVMVSPPVQMRTANFRLMVASGWQHVKKAAYKVTEPEDIAVSSQQEEKYSFFSKYSRVQFLPYANFLSLYGVISTTSIFHLWNWNILLPQVQSTSSHPSQINKTLNNFEINIASILLYKRKNKHVNSYEFR